MKICSICQKEKELIYFNLRSKSGLTYRSQCKSCESEYRKKSYKKNRDSELNKANKYNETHKEERTTYNKNYYERNKQSELIRAKTYRKNNKEYYKNYYRNNKDTYIKYEKMRKLTDPIYKLTKHLRSQFGFIFKVRGLKKQYKTEELLGCSFEEFKIYLESKFDLWMTWENRGLYNGELNYGWDIDHIIPLSSASTEEDLIKLNHYTNLQPLCSYTNRYIKKDNV